MDIVYYHKSCPDGWAAAYVASKKYPEAVLFPLDHGAEFDFYQVINKDVLMVDFSLRTREQNDAIASAAKSFCIYDHHKTAQAVLDGASYATFDMKRSGAGITWDELFGKEELRGGVIIPGQARPWYVDYVEDRDLWNWALPNSKEICAYLGTLEMTKADWEPLDSMEWAAAIGQGIGALAHINHYVREAVKQAQVGMLQGYETSVVNALYLNCSEIGSELAKTHDVSLTWFERHDGVIQFSLRSEGDIDVSAIAKSFNGGGHMHAAGFQLDLMHGRQLIDRILGRLKDDPEAV
jgi:oligoribonuclease NrnB/cAMP/cGMP phosphodiesterase (DHH superfamily)